MRPLPPHTPNKNNNTSPPDIKPNSRNVSFTNDNSNNDNNDIQLVSKGVYPEEDTMDNDSHCDDVEMHDFAHDALHDTITDGPFSDAISSKKSTFNSHLVHPTNHNRYATTFKSFLWCFLLILGYHMFISYAIDSKFPRQDHSLSIRQTNVVQK